MNNQLLKVEQVAAAIGVTTKTIRLWCQAGDVFPTARKLGNRATGQWRILSDDIALLEMLDGAADNAAVLANQSKLIADLQTQLVELQAQVAECQNSYSGLIKSYNSLVAEAQELDKQIEGQHAQIADLQRYKDHYNKQQANKQRRSV